MGNDVGRQTPSSKRFLEDLSRRILISLLELCYEVALGDFDMAQSELEELSRKITTQV